MSSLRRASWGLVFIVGISGLAACSQSDMPAKSNTQSSSNQDKVSQDKPNTTLSSNASPTSAVAVSEKSANANPQGEAVYQQTCRICHETGTLGAPRMGDKSAWQARIAQGKDTLYTHAINGFTGKTGTMPPKGGSAASDSDIKLSVDYMIDKSR